MKKRCLICGMIINEKNYDKNNASFLDENSNERIVRCPFCGVSERYISDDEGIVFDKIDLDEKTKKVSDMGMKLEIFNSEFYLEASKQTKDKRLKKMFKDLSNIEMMHARVHKNFGDFNELPKLRQIDYTKLSSDELLMIEANRREKHAIEFYERYYDQVPKAYKIIFEALTNVEKEHIIMTKDN